MVRQTCTTCERFAVAHDRSMSGPTKFQDRSRFGLAKGKSIRAKNIEDTYRLSPVRQGMLFRSLYARQSGADIEQLVCGLHEVLNVPAFRQIWDRVAAHHVLAAVKAKPRDVVEQPY